MNRESQKLGCGRCRLPYPNDMLSPVIGDPFMKVPVCGICALEMINAIHGSHVKQFRGEMAEDFRVRAINWRRKHPNAQRVTVDR